jgi:hypothetical protein
MKVNTLNNISDGNTLNGSLASKDHLSGALTSRTNTRYGRDELKKPHFNPSGPGDYELPPLFNHNT